VKKTCKGKLVGVTGKVNVRSRLNRWIIAAALSSTALAVVCTAALGGMPRAQAADPVQVSLSASASGTSVSVNGAVRTMAGQGLSGLLITMYLNDSGVGTTATLSDGSFSYAMTAPGAGNYIVRAQWSGDSRYSPGSGTTSVSIPQAQTSLSIAVDPTEVTPGSAVTVTGNLSSGGAPVSAALVSLSVDYGSVDSSVGTGGDGSFTAGITIPDGEGFPATFTVTATYPGDDMHTAATGTATGSITAPPTPDPSEEPNAEATPTIPVTMPAIAIEATPTSGIMDVPSDSNVEGSASPMAIVSIVFFVVALVSVGTLIILGIVSHSQKRLGRDERRGFGTTFGKLW